MKLYHDLTNVCSNHRYLGAWEGGVKARYVVHQELIEVVKEVLFRYQHRNHDHSKSRERVESTLHQCKPQSVQEDRTLRDKTHSDNVATEVRPGLYKVQVPFE